MPTTRTRLAALVAVTLLVLTAGCTTKIVTDTPSTPTPSASDTPTSDEPAPEVALVPGQVFPKGTEPTNVSSGQDLWKMVDSQGNYTGSVAFSKGMPLPDELKVAIVVPVQAAFDAATATGIGVDSAKWTPVQIAANKKVVTTATAVSVEATNKTGRHVVVVFTYYSALGVEWGAISNGEQITGSAHIDRAVTTGRAQTWITQQPNAERYEIVSE